MLDSIFITGGSRGIGAAMVREFAKAGYRVAFTYNKSQEQALALAKETKSYAVKCDVSASQEVSDAVKKARECIGDISVLINNAGICKSGLLLDMQEEDWRSVLAVNTDGMYNVTKAVLPMMLKKGTGRIINISSVWGVYGASCEVVYSTSKAAVLGFTKSLAKEIAASGITVNAIAPGVIDTDMNSAYTDEDMRLIINDIPLGRVAQPSEVAHLAKFLASEAASYITGQVIGIDGGFGM